MPLRIAFSRLTICTKGRAFAIFSKAPPTVLISNQIPANQPVKLVINAPQIPPTCFTLRALPHSKPRQIKNNEIGIIASKAYRIVTVIFSPKITATI